MNQSSFTSQDRPENPIHRSCLTSSGSTGKAFTVQQGLHQRVRVVMQQRCVGREAVDHLARSAERWVTTG